MSKLRGMTTVELEKRLIHINLEIAKFKSASTSGETNIHLPTGAVGGNVSWGLAKKYKKERARIITILNNDRYPKLKGHSYG
jgi:ribosomal protein L29